QIVCAGQTACTEIFQIVFLRDGFGLRWSLDDLRARRIDSFLHQISGSLLLGFREKGRTGFLKALGVGSLLVLYLNDVVTIFGFYKPAEFARFQAERSLFEIRYCLALNNPSKFAAFVR